MAIILLTHGRSTIVDDERYEELNEYNWYAAGADYRPARRLKGGPRKLIYMYHQILHVLPWVMSKMGKVVDHIDGNPLNNRLENLRIVTQHENIMNDHTHRDRIGICFATNENKFKAYLDRPLQKRIWLGTFVTREEAAAALQQAKVDYECE